MSSDEGVIDKLIRSLLSLETLNDSNIWMFSVVLPATNCKVTSKMYEYEENIDNFRAKEYPMLKGNSASILHHEAEVDIN